MAILEDVPGIKITVRVEGVDCTEYDDTNADNAQEPYPTSSRYIESIDDATFSIHLEMDSAYIWGYKTHILTFKAKADGKQLHTKVLKERHLTKGCGISKISDAYLRTKTGDWIVREPRFSSVNTGEVTNAF